MNLAEQEALINRAWADANEALKALTLLYDHHPESRSIARRLRTVVVDLQALEVANDTVVKTVNDGKQIDRKND
jgi:hypothetical protein